MLLEADGQAAGKLLVLEGLVRVNSSHDLPPPSTALTSPPASLLPLPSLLHLSPSSFPQPSCLALSSFTPPLHPSRSPADELQMLQER
eukprot:756781-Hanusia_phi.AAC.3